ncbi:MAG: nucleoside triphosphate pyrophosphohydrolase [Cytophagales bacterium]|nr:MAG: nucleoside triphosphate pyrophosphohydrolase [Cytophagales bacterium]
MERTLKEFERLLVIMDELRLKCPWDKKQTMESLRYLSIEEVYELSDAILEKEPENIKKELGDVLLHIVFYAKIASEQASFQMYDVINSLCEKLISRHPHIYGDVRADDEEQVKRNWEQLKLKEKGGNKTVLAGVPSSLPALVKAMRIQEKAKASGFDWDNKSQVWDKVKEELDEFQDEVQQGLDNKEKIEAEFGDVLFSLINYARFIAINPEDALEKTNKKFIKRFTYLEQQSAIDGLKLDEMTLEQMEAYWQKAKHL